MTTGTTSGGGIDAELRARAEAWLAQDPDPVTRQELTDLLARAERGAPDALADLDGRFAGRLAFGTAGLRAELGAGPLRMNRVVVRQAAAGLARYLPAGARVVVGYDARHNSDVFARDTARVVAAAGGEALLLPSTVPTPVLAFAVRQLEADAGVMCTASHNPPKDNGYKVYLGDGAQIIPPVDREIAAAIDAVAAEDLPVALAPLDDPRIRYLDGSVLDAYLRHAVARSRSGPRDLTIVYTPLHGVGGRVAVDVLRRCGFTEVLSVAAQAEPDPDFPTVAFPNPEEPGALDLALELARARGADLVLANDPDADRLGVAVPALAGDRGGAPGHGDPADGWAVLTGNEIGVLLADHLLRTTTGADRLVVTTFVSSRLLRSLAVEHGVHFAEVLTGFKWVVRPALDDPALRLVFGYEEALGFSVDPYVRDKDGITAALAFAELVAALRAGGRTVWDRLEDLARRHGHHATETWAVRFDGPDAAASLAAVMAALRAEPPTELAGRRVVGWQDMARGERLPATDALVADLDDGARVVVRPSGTEPKLKIYGECIVDVPAAADGYLEARRTGRADLAELFRALADGVVRDPRSRRSQV